MSFLMMKSDDSIVDINASTIGLQLGVQCRGGVCVNELQLVDYPAPYFVNVKDMKTVTTLIRYIHTHQMMRMMKIYEKKS